MGDIGSAVSAMFIGMAVLIICFVPLGIWKAFELLSMIHFSIGLK
jgi:hypothetical protein